MEIKGITGLSNEQIEQELRQGARFVCFDYVVSIVLMTFKRSSSVHFIRAGEGAFGKGIPFTLITFFFGWWGIPWGPIYSIGVLFKNLSGGRDVTGEVLASMGQAPQAVPAADAQP